MLKPQEVATTDSSRSSWATDEPISPAPIIETWDRPDSAKLILLSSLARAAGVTASGRTRTQNSSRLVSYRSWLVRSAWPHSANSFCR